MDVLADEIRARLRDAAEPARAAGQQAYMKSAMPFLGVKVPDVRRIVRSASKEHPAAELLAVAEALWDHAGHREERYAAMMLLTGAATAGDLATLSLIERFVREGQWWDFTDDLAHRVSELMDFHPGEIATLMRKWSTDDDLWIRRTSIICQLQRGPRTDDTLLSDVIEANLADPDFFIRKAIGWALRDFARTDPAWVQRFADNRPLSPLSRREALKHVSAMKSVPGPR